MITAGSSKRSIAFSVEKSDALDFDADVLALKYAQTFYGVDALVASRLEDAGVSRASLEPAVGDLCYVATRGAIRARHVLFVGVPVVWEFSYPGIRQFASNVLEIVAERAPRSRSVAATLHGVGYGLDEAEAALAELAGFLDAIGQGRVPPSLERIAIVESDPSRAERIAALFAHELAQEDYAQGDARTRVFQLSPGRLGNRADGVGSYQPAIRSAGTDSDEKGHAFVAMPFAAELEDLFHYGIQAAVRANDYLCERVDQEAFVGDVLDRVKKKIETASVVIADLSGANPNVYLEVGYAWGCHRPTVLLLQRRSDLKFDVQNQRCLVYGSIRELEEVLTNELRALRMQGAI